MLPNRPAHGSRLPSRVSLSVLAMGLIIASAHTAYATDGPGGTDTLRWVNPNGGAWTDAANWNPPNVPDNDNEVALIDSFAGHQPYTVTLDTGLLAGGLNLRAVYATLDVNTKGVFRLDGVPINKGTIRLSGGVDMHVNRPLFWSEGGTIIIGDKGATIEIRMPYNSAGTLDLFRNGKLYLDGGSLNLFCSALLEGTIERRSGTGEVNIEYAVPQSTTIAPNTVVRVTGLMDLLEHQGHLINNGTLIVSGTFQGTAGGYYNSLTGTGELVLDEGRIMTGNENTGVLINEAGHTIRGCGQILATLINYGTIESTCTNSALFMTSPVENHGKILDPRGILWIKGNAAHITSPGRIEATGGTIWIDEGASIDNRMGVIGMNGGSIELGRGTTASIQGGTIEGAGDGALHVQGTATLQDLTLSPTAVLRTWPGATTIAAGASFTNRGTSRVQGTFRLGATTNYIQSGGSTWMDGGVIQSGRPVQIQGGELKGYGTIAGPVASGGTVRPDPRLGALTIQGDYSQLPNGSLNVEFAGTGPGQTSRLAVTGNASLAGTLAVSAVDGYAPVPGHEYQVLSYGTLSGEFGAVLGSLAGQLDVTPLYATDGLGLLVTGTVGVGDATLPQALRFFGSNGARGGAEAAFVIELPKDATLTVRAYDARGREVARLADGMRPAGVHRFALRGPGAASDLPSGVYFARATVESGGTTETRTTRVVSLR